MYENFLSTYSDKKSCHTSTTLQTSIERFVSDSWASCENCSGLPVLVCSYYGTNDEDCCFVSAAVEDCHVTASHDVIDPTISVNWSHLHAQSLQRFHKCGDQLQRRSHCAYTLLWLWDMACSGVFRISVRIGATRRSRRPGGVMWWRWLAPRKIIFCPQNDKFGCTLTQYLTGRKHGKSL